MSTNGGVIGVPNAATGPSCVAQNVQTVTATGNYVKGNAAAPNTVGLVVVGGGGSGGIAL